MVVAHMLMPLLMDCANQASRECAVADMAWSTTLPPTSQIYHGAPHRPRHNEPHAEPGRSQNP